MQELESSPLQTRRLVLFVALSFLVFVGWSYIAPRPVQPPPGAPQAASAQPPGATAATAAAAGPGSDGIVAAPAPAEAIQEASPRRVSASTAAWRVELSNVGGRLTSWQLLGEGDHADPSKPLELIRRRHVAGPPDEDGKPTWIVPAEASDDQDVLPLQLITPDAALDARIAKALHVVTAEESPAGRVLTARWSDGEGTSVEKILTLRDDAPIATLEARLTIAGSPAPFRLAWGPGISNHTQQEHSNIYFRRGVVTYLAGEETMDVERPDKQRDLPESSVRWAALQDSYFAVLFTPVALAGSPAGVDLAGPQTGFHVGGALRLDEKGKADKKQWPEEIVLEVPFTPAQPVQAIYAGPRDRKLLNELDGAFRSPPRLGMLTHLGMLDGLARLLHVPLVWFRSVTSSWGWSVVLLTLLVRVVIGPLQFISMKKMRGMQDKMKPMQAKLKALDERYAKLAPTRENKMKQVEEKQKLMLEAGVNPFETLSGCLPLLITMPVFFALLKLLPNAPEFRHESFLFWKDLAAADPSHVLPVLAAVLTLISTKMGMSSSSATIDPMQRNMLYMFPLMLIWLCWSAPLAFVVYQVAMSAVQIGQQQLFNLALPPPDAAPKNGPKAGKPTEKTGASSGDAAGKIETRKKGRKR